ncbi:hypothetical protein WR25_22623 [Diploscapter pachys]|uniref:Receptor L-domain domain-containing protein n=1 Tax=Diploscapter pachys TaxID=2018661 RepID=A0A2A2LQX2_9BILA|nr:hypothetical protein WR25_22623 [Diploscapter pachys]
MEDLNPEMLQQLKALVVIAGNQKAKSIDLGKLTRVAIKDNQLLTILIASNTFCLEEATSIRLLQQYAIIADTPICNPTKVHCMTSLSPNNPVSVFTPSNLPAGCQILYGGIVFQKVEDEQ